MTDTRNWKCFFGMHQWKQIGEISRQHFEYSTSKRPYRITTVYRMQCAHCGKITHEEF